LCPVTLTQPGAAQSTGRQRFVINRGVVLESAMYWFAVPMHSSHETPENCQPPNIASALDFSLAFHEKPAGPGPFPKPKGGKGGRERVSPNPPRVDQVSG